MHDSTFTLSLPPLTEATAAPAAREILAAARTRIGMVPNMYARMAHAPALLQTYAEGYERFRAESGLSPAEQEVVFLTISHENECTYCVAAHSTLADHASAVPAAVTDAIRSGLEAPDARLEALSRFTRHVVATRGRPTTAEAGAFLAAGFTERQILYIILAVAVKTISNYSNHVFGTPLDTVFESRAWMPAAR